MHSDLIAAGRYAEALFRLAQKQGLLAQVAREVEQLLPLLAPAAPLRAFLENPQIATGKKRDLVNRTLQSSLSSMLDEFVLLMIDKNRVLELEPALCRFLTLVEEHEGIFPAQLTTAVPLREAEQALLQRTLEAHTGVRLRIHYEVDPRIIGGAVFRYRDELIDGSIRGGLDAIRARLKPLKVY